MIILALSTANKIVVGGMAAIFIAFALVSAFVIPRRNPNFPNRKVGLYVLGAAVLFLAMITTILVFGVEEEHESAQGETPAAETTSTETGTETGTGTTTGETGEATTGEAEGAGDPAAGKQVFASAGCGGCHTLKDARSSGNVGPNLDDAKPDEDLIHTRVTQGKSPMPSFADQLSDKQIADVVAYVYSATHS